MLYPFEPLGRLQHHYSIERQRGQFLKTDRRSKPAVQGRDSHQLPVRDLQREEGRAGEILAVMTVLPYGKAATKP